MFGQLHQAILEVVNLGGPVVALLLAVSVLSLTVVLFKLWQFGLSGVGRHRSINRALQHIDAGRLIAAPDCGLGLLGRERAMAKLKNMCEAAQAV